MKQSLKNLGLVGILVASTAVGRGLLTRQVYAGNEEQKAPCPEVTRIMERTGYSEDKIYDMIYKALDRMMSVPDQPQALTQRQNYEMKSEIGKKMLYNLADKLGNEDCMTSDDEVCKLMDVILDNPGIVILKRITNKYLSKFSEDEQQAMQDNKEIYKKFPGIDIFEKIEDMYMAHLYAQFSIPENYK